TTMNNFTFNFSTKIIFGKDEENRVGDEIKNFGANKILLHYYDDKIIKNMGLYDKVIKSLRDCSLTFIELPGVLPNPRISLVRKGIKICRDEGIDFILAIGGGSVIDSAKAIAAGVFYNGDAWDFYEKKAIPKKVLNVGTILTIAGSGSEASQYAVLTNEERWLKKGFGSELLRPKFAIMNPEISFSVPNYHKFSGAIDIMSHILERYFSRGEDYIGLNDLYCEASLKNVKKCITTIFNNPFDYKAHAELMWTSTIAQNDLLNVGSRTDWEIHSHGAGLAILLPAWMRYAYKNKNLLYKFSRISKEVWDIKDDGSGSLEEIALKGIESFEKFIKNLGLPLHIKETEINIDNEKLKKFAARCVENGPIGIVFPLNKTDILNILEISI
ncbi:MAG: iron-containing alcohol dehydrogenase, partial [Candidatus Humimicrobiaceae bacterium]